MLSPIEIKQSQIFQTLTFSELEKPEEKLPAPGQVFTPSVIADLMAAMCINSEIRNIIDPACGEGIFFRSILKLNEKFHLFKNNPVILGIDIDGDVLKKAINSLSSLYPPVKFICADFLEMFETLPHFDLVIGNPPFLRQEKIRNTKHLTKKINRKLGSNVLNARSGLHSYFLAAGLCLLSSKGKLAFVMPESFLTSNSDSGLRKYLATYYHVEAILRFEKGRIFSRAGIKTCVIIISRKKEPSSKIKIINIKPQILEHLFSSTEPQDYYRKLLNIAEIVKTAGESKFSNEPEGLGFSNILSITLRPVKHAMEVNNWNLLAGENEVFRRVFLENVRNGKVIPFSKIAFVKRGITTGADPWFYVEKIKEKENRMLIKSGDGSEWFIEKSFLKPVLQNPSGYSRILIRNKEIKTFVVSIPQSVSIEGYAVEKYVKHGSTSLYRMGKNKKTIPAETVVCRSRKKWYALPHYRPAPLLWIKTFDRKYRHFLMEKKVIANQRFYMIYPYHESEEVITLIGAILNSYVIAYYCETVKTAMGYGALELTVEDVKKIPFPNIYFMSQSARRKILDVFRPLLSRDIQDYEAEVEKPDRRALDEAVLCGYGIEDRREREKILDVIHACLLESVNNRVSARAWFV